MKTFIFYRENRFQVLDQGFFFFAPNPDQIYARSWEGHYPAFCSWARLRDNQNGATFYLYNVHFDHSSLRNRFNSARLVADRIAGREHPGHPGANQRPVAFGSLYAVRYPVGQIGRMKVARRATP
jgi:hypothetical protein